MLHKSEQQYSDFIIGSPMKNSAPKSVFDASYNRNTNYKTDPYATTNQFVKTPTTKIRA